MKKFSTAAAILALASVFIAPACFAGAADEANVNPDSVHCAFLENAPDQHTVVTGDTLWGISAKFLQHPWCWPQVWGLNRDQIANPHWIYPGQIVYFDRVNGRLRLGTPVASSSAPASTAPSSEGKMEPQTRTKSLNARGISSIPNNLIEPYLSKPLIVGEKELNSNARIMATQEGRVVVGKGDHAYVRGDLKGQTAFQVFRPGRALNDPDTGKVMAYEAVYLGEVKLTHLAKTADEASTVDVTEAKEEMGVGDRLLPVPLTPLINYVPHPPARPTVARIASIYEGVANAGQSQIVTINRGKNDGIDIGTVLQLYRYGKMVADPTDNKKMVKLPDEEYGSLFVFRVFDNLSYALIMEVRDAVTVGDVAKSPE